MAISEKSPEDKQKFKAALTGVAILLIIGSFGAGGITSFTGVDVESLCKTDLDTQEVRCVDDDDAKSMVLDIFFWLSILVAGVGFGVLVMAGIKY